MTDKVKNLESLKNARSFLFVPANRTDRVSKAFATNADWIIVDLEDAVSPADKVGARAGLLEWFGLNQDKQVLVRVNAVGTAWHDEDLIFCAHPQVAGVVLPKAECSSSLKNVKNFSDKPILPIIETPLGFKNLDEISASESVIRLLFGKLDLAVELSLNPDESDSNELVFLPYRAAMVLSSAIAKIAQPVDGVYTDINNEDALAVYVKRAKDSGFGAVLLIHPKQIDIVHKEFTPTDAETLWAKKVVELVTAAGGAAVSFEGRMIDAPVFLRAKRIIDAVK